MSIPQVSLVIVTWNSAEVVGGLLDSLGDNPPAAAFEVLVVDNGSGDGTTAVVASHPLKPRLIANPHNRGLAAANNQGIAAAQGTFVLVCNPDLVLQAGAVDALLDCAARHPRAAFVVAKLIHPDGTLQAGVGDLPTFREAYRGRAAARRARLETGFWWDGWAHDTEKQIGHGQEACYLVRRAALAEVGPQDEGFRLDWEGIDWSARVYAAGWEIWFCPAAQVVHIGGTSLGKARLRWVIWSHRGMYRYFAKRRPPAVRPLLLLAIGARGVLKALLLFRPDLYARALRPEQP
ncbi:MAG: putative glycosyltransferase [Frankiales bacterium]|nr:putative glycosyltransferase [Frankiales bacterium]